MMREARFAEWDEEVTFEEADERRSRRRKLPWLRMGLLSSLCIAGLVYFADDRQRATPSLDLQSRPVPVLASPAPVWRPISPSPALYAFEGSADPIALEARQHTGGAREDTLTLGRFGDVRHARITLAQGLAEAAAEPARSFFVDLVRRSAEAGLSVVRNGQSRMVATKFGLVEAASVILAAADEQTCQAFRFTDPQAAFGFHGWLCGSETRPVDEVQLACLLDRLEAVGSGSPSLKAVFARSENSRVQACQPGAPGARAPVRAASRP